MTAPAARREAIVAASALMTGYCALDFACQPETFPVFWQWAKANGLGGNMGLQDFQQLKDLLGQLADNFAERNGL
jgi:hypothetical protein